MAEPNIAYNDLLMIGAADRKLRKELAGAGISLGELLGRLYDTFKNHPGYAVCLTHRHFDLEEDEVIVTRESTEDSPSGIVARSRPEFRSDVQNQIIPERWHKNGGPLEFRYSQFPLPDAELPAWLPPTLLRDFQDIVDAENITMLGICLTPSFPNSSSPATHHFLEMATQDAEREQEIRLVPNLSPPAAANTPPMNVLRAIENRIEVTVATRGMKQKTIVGLSSSVKYLLAGDSSVAAPQTQCFEAIWSPDDQSNELGPSWLCNHVCCGADQQAESD